ncbi:MAG TPA: protein kinase [Polyangia bacterium]|nr:protein kinase [Polyangia bacterium]
MPTDGDAQTAAADPLVGRTIAGGRYTVTAVLGRGGMGVVYAAIQHPVNRKVALKLIHRELAGERHIIDRFMQEMNLTAAIEHPHTVRLYDVGDLDGQPFITTEFLEGRTLRDELARVGRMPPTRAVAIGLQIARALRGAQAHGVVHRDLKPENIMLLDRYGERDYVKVLDFGIARSLHRTGADFRTGTGAILGTPQYMSPEQCEGKPVDGRSDLYTLGLIIYELCAGALPFPATPSIPAMLLAHVTQTPPDLATRAPEVPPALARLVMSLLSKSPDERPADADAVIATLEEMPGGTRGTAPSPAVTGATAPTQAAVTPATVAHAEPPPRRQGRGPVIASVLVLAAAAALLGPRMFSEPLKKMSAGEEPRFPRECDAALARQLSEIRRPGTPDAEALPVLSAIVAACPSAAVAQALLGTTLTRLDRDGEAEPPLRTALSLEPDYANAQHNLAVLLVKRGRATEALPLLDAVLAHDDAHATARMARAQARLMAGNVAGAVEDLRVQTERRPQQGNAWALLAEALARSGDATGARAAACRAVGLGVASARERCGTADGPSP